MADIVCKITITETGDGKLHIMGKVPDGKDDSMAVVLAHALLVKSQDIMNEVLGDRQKVEKFTTQ